MKLMNLVRNLQALGNSPDIIKRTTLDHAPDWVFDQPFGGPTGISAMLQVPGVSRPAENLVMVFGCLRARTEAIGGVPLRLTDSNDNIIESGPVWNLLNKPNNRQYWRQYVRQLETYNTLYDCIVVLKVGEPNRPPDELIPLSPGFLRPVQGVHAPSGTPVAVAWDYTDPFTGSYKRFQPEQLMIHQGFNPDAPLASLSPINVLRRTMQGDLAAREQNLGLFLNDATPRGVLHTDKSLTKEQSEEVLKKWEDKQMGFMNRHKTAVLWGGLKYDKTGLSPQELEFLDGLKFLRTDYYIVFRVKPSMVGEMTGETGLSQGSSTDAQKVQWWEDIGLAELDLIAGMHQGLINAEFENQVSQFKGRNLRRNEKLSRERFVQRSVRLRSDATARQNALALWFDDNSIPALVRSRLSKIDQAVKILALGWKPDDVNDYLDLGLPPHPDNLGRVGFSLTPIGAESQSAEGKAPAGEENDLTTKDTKVTKEDSAGRALDNLERAFENAERAKVEKFKGVKQAFDKFCAPREKAAAKKFSRFYIEQRDRVLERLGAEGKRMQPQMNADARRSEDLKRADNAEILKKIFPMDEENKQLLARLTPLWTTHMEDGWKFFNQETETVEKTNPFQVDDPMIQKAIEKRQIQGAHINETTEGDLKKVITEAFDAGETTAGLSDRIASWYNDNCVGENSSRPMVAARTQTAGIVNEGRMMAAQEVGGLKKAWLHGSPAEARPAHVDAQEKYMAAPIGLDEKFEVNGYECDQPGSTELPVEEVANCTCMVVFVKE